MAAVTSCKTNKVVFIVGCRLLLLLANAYYANLAATKLPPPPAFALFSMVCHVAVVHDFQLRLNLPPSCQLRLNLPPSCPSGVQYSATFKI
jgi:hypothetical protein